MNAQGPTPGQDKALSTLVERGTLTDDQASAVRAALWAGAARKATNPASVLIEVAGYVGGGLMLGGAALLVGLNWEALGRDGAVLVLVGYALALAVAGILVAGGPHRIIGLRDGSSPVRRRLVGVLLAISAGPAAMAAGISVDRHEGLVGGLVGLAVAVVAYFLLPTIPGVLVTAAMSAIATTGLIELQMDDTYQPLVPTLYLVGLGVAWTIATEVGLVKPRHIGLALGTGFAIFGAQMLIGAEGYQPWAYGLTFVAGLGCFLVYWLERATVLLAFGVVAVTIAVPEAVTDWTDDALSGPAILLISGAVLVAASAIGLWLRSARNAHLAHP